MIHWQSELFRDVFNVDRLSPGISLAPWSHFSAGCECRTSSERFLGPIICRIAVLALEYFPLFGEGSDFDYFFPIG